MRREDLLQKFLLSENIEIASKSEVRANFSVDNIIECLVKFHKSLKGKKNYTIGLISDAGRFRTEQKNLIKRAIEFSEEISIDLTKLIDYAVNCYEYLDENEFIYLIERAYKNSEITLGKVYPNIEMKEEKILVCDVSRIKFGMVEDDIIRLLKKVYPKGFIKSYDGMIDEFIVAENLDDISKKYIYSVLDFPTEILTYISQCYLRDFRDEAKIKKELLNLEKKFIML